MQRADLTPSYAVNTVQKKKPGNDLLSRREADIIGARGLTAVFGMGTSVALLLWSPGKVCAVLTNSASYENESESVSLASVRALEKGCQPFGGLVPVS